MMDHMTDKQKNSFIINQRIDILVNEMRKDFTCLEQSQQFLNKFCDSIEPLADDSKKDFYITRNYRTYYFDKKDLSEIEILKEHAYMATTNVTNKLAKLSEKLQLILGKTIKEYFMFDSIIKDLLTLLNYDNKVDFLVESFQQFLQLSLYQLKKKIDKNKEETPSISLLTFSQNIGATYCKFIFSSLITSTLSTNASLLDYFHALNDEYFITILKNIENFENKERKEELDAIYVPVESIFSDIFKQSSTPLVINTLNLFVLEALVKECFVNEPLFKDLKEHLLSIFSELLEKNKLKKTKAKNTIDNNENKPYIPKIIRLYTEENNTEDTKENNTEDTKENNTDINTEENNVLLTFILNVINTKQNEINAKFGMSFLKPFIDKNELFTIITEYGPFKKNAKRNVSKITLKDADLFIPTNNALPVIVSTDELNQSKVIKQTIIDRFSYFIKQEQNELIHQNYYLKGVTHNYESYKKQLSNNRFEINVEFTEIFLAMLNEINKQKKLFDTQKADQLSYFYNYLTDEHLAFLHELYLVDFKNLWNTGDKGIIDKLLYTSIDFNNLKKLKLNIDPALFGESKKIIRKKTKKMKGKPKEFIKITRDKYFFYKSLNIRIYSYKIIIAGLLNNLDIMRNFKYFKYMWFYDARGRHLLVASSLNPQGFPLSKNFLRFQNNWDFNKLIKNHDKKTAKVLKMNVLKCAREQLASLANLDKLQNLAQDYSLEFSNVAEDSFRLFLRHKNELNIKPTKLFKTWILYNDILNFELDKKGTYKFNSFFEKDATSSGLQNISTGFLKLRNLASLCNICDLNKSKLLDLARNVQNEKEKYNLYVLMLNNTLYKDGDSPNKYKEYNKLKEQGEGAIILKNIEQLQLKQKSFNEPEIIQEDINIKFQKFIKEVLSSLDEFISQEEFIKIKEFIVNKPKIILEKREYFIQYISNNIINKTMAEVYTRIQSWSILLSNKFIKEIFKKFENINRQDYNNITGFLTLEYLIELKLILQENQQINDFILSKKVSKILIMTGAYGSRPYGRVIQIKEAFIKHCFKDGYPFIHKEIKHLVKVAFFIDKLYVMWINQNIPELMYLYDTTKKLTKEKNWPSFSIASKYFSYTYLPFKEIKKRFSTGFSYKGKAKIRDVIMRTYDFNCIDYNKIRKSFIANLIQFSDATVCSLYYEQLNQLQKHICGFTNHDCFYIDMMCSMFLSIFVKQAYKNLYNLDLLETIFKEKFPEFYADIMTKLKPHYARNDRLFESDINNDKFLSH